MEFNVLVIFSKVVSLGLGQSVQMNLGISLSN